MSERMPESYYEDMVASKIGNFEILKFYRNRQMRNARYFKVKCKCGNVRNMACVSLKYRKTCGCGNGGNITHFKIKQKDQYIMSYPYVEAKVLLQYINDIRFFAKHGYSKRHMVVKQNHKVMLLPYQVVVPHRVAQDIVDNQRKLEKYFTTTHRKTQAEEYEDIR